jgi:hypothetical protein
MVGMGVVVAVDIAVLVGAGVAVGNVVALGAIVGVGAYVGIQADNIKLTSKNIVHVRFILQFSFQRPVKPNGAKLSFCTKREDGRLPEKMLFFPIYDSLTKKLFYYYDENNAKIAMIGSFTHSAYTVSF